MGLQQLLGRSRQSRAVRSSWFLVQVPFRECPKDTDTVPALPALPEPQKSPGNALHGGLTDSGAYVLQRRGRKSCPNQINQWMNG